MIRTTKKQEALLSAIKEYLAEEGCYPHLEKLSHLLSRSKSSVYQSMKSLIEKGFLEKDGRSYRLSRDERDGLFCIRVPFYEGNDFIYVPSVPASSFAIKVFSDDMSGGGIKRGDIAVFDSDASELKNGDIVLAKLSDELYIRRFYRRPEGSVDLIPENDSIGKIASYSVEIKGRLLLIVRKVL